MGSVFYKMIKDLLAPELQKEFIYITLLHNYFLEEKQKKVWQRQEKVADTMQADTWLMLRTKTWPFFSVTCSNLST